MNVIKAIFIAGTVICSGLVNAQADPELECLGNTIYHSAFDHDFRGKVLTGELVLNRVKSPDFPDTICSVVYQKDQFFWANKRLPIVDNKQYEQSMQIAYDLINTGSAETSTVLYRHHYLMPRPAWSYWRKKRFRHGDYIFYE